MHNRERHARAIPLTVIDVDDTHWARGAAIGAMQQPAPADGNTNQPAEPDSASSVARFRQGSDPARAVVASRGGLEPVDSADGGRDVDGPGSLGGHRSFHYQRAAA